MTIFGIGTVVVDHVVELPRFPAADTKVAVTNDWKQVGGPVPVALSTAGFYGSATSFLGRWGNDEHGRFIAGTLRVRGVDTSECAANDEWSTGFAHVWVDSITGSRTIAYSRGQFPIPGADDIDENCILTAGRLQLRSKLRPPCRRTEARSFWTPVRSNREWTSCCPWLTC